MKKDVDPMMRAGGEAKDFYRGKVREPVEWNPVAVIEMGEEPRGAGERSGKVRIGNDVRFVVVRDKIKPACLRVDGGDKKRKQGEGERSFIFTGAGFRAGGYIQWRRA